MTKSSIPLAVLGCVGLAGCCNSQRIVPEPGKITLQEAMQSVGEGLTRMHDALGGMKTGLMPSAVEVTFNVSASATDTGKLYVEVGAQPVHPLRARSERKQAHQRQPHAVIRSA